MTDSQPALDLRRVAKLYGRTAALRSTSLRVEAGQILVLLGPNGSGKTTLLKILAGAVTPTLGEGTVLGGNLRTDRYGLRSQVGLLAGETYLYDDLTARENLRFAATMAGRRPPAAEIEFGLARVGLGSRGGERVRGFSSGMKRRLSLARVLLLKPRLLLLDEPYNSLDEDGAVLVDRVAHGLSQEGGTVVLATHDAERGLALADRVVVLERGSLRFDGSVHAYRSRHAEHVG